MVQHRQYVNAVGIPTFFSGLIGMFVFDVLQIPSGCRKIAPPPNYGPDTKSVTCYFVV
jgi:hypothetical protein